MKSIEVVYVRIGNLELYRTFYMVALTGSVTRAAELLFITQPSVSYAIKQLEEQLGIALFIRKPKGVELTAEGKVLYRHVAEGMEAMATGEQAVEQFKLMQRGEVRIGTSDTLCKFFLLPYLEHYLREYPDIHIQLSHGKTPDIVRWLRDGQADCGIVHLPVNTEWFDVIPLAEIQDCFVVGERYKHLAQGVVPLREVFGHPLIVLSQNSNTRDFIEAIAEEHGLQLKPEIELGSVELLIEFARIGLGVSFLSREFIEPQLREGTLYEVRTAEPIPSRTIGIATVKGSPLPTAARKLIGLLQDGLHTQLGEG
ncbi:LysR family transcriptional regulator [Paenibacillus tarimensis]|uniref:LysR family transcriptional regulator n=1 Tax=Paenibacillus tarimensis TaxID=416012 RepID=UPI001F353CC7|nr:LysR family transcriptional regulator [Paenibacillus tarimensis]MCF2945224.1 LysR family transcriptional regulator [Paenibacillus tarimensis]